MEREIVRLNMDKDFEAFEELSVISFGENTNSKKGQMSFTLTEKHCWQLIR